MARPLGTYSATADFERQHVRPRMGRTLIVGSRVYEGRADRRVLFRRAEGWDMLPGNGVDRVVNLEEGIPDGTEFEFDHIECISVLEHSRKPWLLAQNLERLMRVNATLHLTVPFIWREHAYPSDYWRFTINGVQELFSKVAWVELCYAHAELAPQSKKIRSTKVDEYPYYARTEVCAFGIMP